MNGTTQIFRVYYEDSDSKSKKYIRLDFPNYEAASQYADGLNNLENQPLTKDKYFRVESFYIKQ